MTLKTHFRLGKLDDCDLRGAILQAAIFEGVSLCGCNFEDADLSYCEFYMVSAIGANFKGANLMGAKIFGGIFADTSFANCDLSDAMFLADNMGGAVNLRGADFINAKIVGANFESVFTDSYTKLPSSNI